MERTPGPWEIERSGGGWITRIFSANPSQTSICYGSIEEANARLIAAAPDLLAACKSAIVALKGREHDGFLRDAIAKAEAA